MAKFMRPNPRKSPFRKVPMPRLPREDADCTLESILEALDEGLARDPVTKSGTTRRMKTKIVYEFDGGPDYDDHKFAYEIVVRRVR
jgi:hypothetical protein